MSELRAAIQLLDGPEAGNTIMGVAGEPPDKIVIFRTQLAAAGTLVFAEDNGKYDYFTGDLLYHKVSRSELFDKPEFKGHPNVMPGCAYKLTRAVPPSECYQEPAA